MASGACERFREQFSDACEGMLQDASRGAFEQHLRSCAPCRTELAAFRGALAALHECEPEPVPPSFHTALEKHLRASQPSPQRRRFLVPLIAAAACLLITTSMLGWIRHRVHEAPTVWVANASVERLRAGSRVAFAPGSKLELLAGDILLASDTATLSAPGIHASVSACSLLLVEQTTPVVIWHRFAKQDEREAPVATNDRWLPPATLTRTEVLPARTSDEEPNRVTRERPARGLQVRIDTAPLAALLGKAWEALRSTEPALSPAPPGAEPAVANADWPRPDESNPQANEPTATVASPPADPAPATFEPTSPVEVRRSQGHIEITTSGTPRELVPALLALLAEGDAELRTAASEHLQLMHDGFMENPALASRLAPVPEIPESRDSRWLAALRNRPSQPTEDPFLRRWQNWWQMNEPVLEER